MSSSSNKGNKLSIVASVAGPALTINKSGINFIGMGVSGGEIGALTGPSLMPGGQQEAYNLDSLYYRHQLKCHRHLIKAISYQLLHL
jgi:hypothetical protein